MMKSAFRCVQIVLLFYGVFGADEDEVKAVSVMEGDSVTLDPDQTQIKKFNQIEWRFRGPIIAQTDGNDISYPTHTEIFRGRLQLDVTGSLTIKNMKTKHSGLYELKIDHGAGTAVRKFSVTVYESASDPGESEMRSVSVMSGDRVTLQTGVTQISGDELIVWRFGDEGKVIAKADIEAKSSPLYYDERFRDRLELERDQTGSLIITNTRSTDSGFYTVKISSRTRTVYKRFSVSVSVIVIEPGLSSGAVAGIVLVFLAAVAAAAVGFIYYRRKISELQKQILTVTKGEDVTLKPNKTIQKGDVMQWMFGEGERQTSIAKFIGETGEFVTHDYAADGRFSGTLDLDETTGSLTIRNSRPEHSGHYTLYITSSSGDSQQRFIITVSETLEEISVEEGDTVTLNLHTEIQRDDQIQWMFGPQYVLIAQIRGQTGEICDDVLDGRFRGRLKLEKTGSLTITNITPECAGLYELQISSSSSSSTPSRRTLFKRFRVSIPRRWVSVTAGDSVHLSTDRPKIKRDDVIEWMFGGEIIAEIQEGAGKTHDGADERFRDRLELNDQTGDLTIKNSTAEHEGDYNLKIRSRKGNTNKAYRVTITWRHVFVTAGESVRLSTDRPEIDRDDVIEWRFRDKIIAEIKEGTGKTHDGADGRFRDRLQLDDQTGDLTIKNFTDKDEGYYILNISNSKGTTDNIYSVTIRDERRHVSVNEGESVHLSTDLPEIERDDVIEWMCGDEIIAEIKGGTGETHGAADGRFRNRLQLNDRTGDLTIKNFTDEDEGYYKLKISNSKGNTNRTYRVTIRGRHVSVNAGDSVRLSTERPEIDRDDEIQWMCGDEIIAEIKGGTRKTHDGADERFGNRLELDDQTGDLTINDSTAEDEGDYKLKIRSSKGNTNRTYSVTITWKHVSVTAGESVHLSTDRPKIERDDEIQWRFEDEIIAEIKGGTRKTHDGADDGRFRDRLELNDQTGDLTIKNSTDEDAGDYKLNISNRKGNTNKAYRVTITWKHVSVTEGESVRLSTNRPKIKRDDVIEWRFRDKIIAEIKGGTRKTRDGADGRFRDRLELNDQTGDLTIKNFTDEDEGYYKLKISNSKGNTNRAYRVTIPYEAREKSPVKGNNGKRVDESAVEMQPLMIK